MRRLLEILFNVEPAPWTEGGGFRVEWLALPSGDWALIVLVAVVLAAWGTLWLYRREGRGLSWRVRLMLTGLRMLAALGVLAMLLEPVIVFTKQEFSPSTIIVLKDASESMELADAWGDAEQAARLAQALDLPGGEAELRERSRRELAERLLDTTLREALAAGGQREVRELAFTGRLLSSPAAGDGADKTATGIGAAVREAILAHRGRPLAGVLLITEGQSNTGESPVKAAEFAGDEGVPVVVLAAGTPDGPRNARLVKIDASPVVFVADPNPLSVVVDSRGMQSVPASVVLERRRDGGAWEEVGRRDVVLGETGQLQTLAFEFSEREPARLEFRASLADAGPELTLDDNVALAEVRAIRQKIRVLFVAGSAFPEVEFIRNTLLRDAGIDVSTWLMSADENYAHPGSTPIRRLPATQEELNAYDCVVLYDPDPNLWPAHFPQMLAYFVADAGGGLVYVAGERMTPSLFERQGDPAADIAKLLPVVVEPGLFQSEVVMRLSAQEPWRLDVTPEGRTDPIFRFAEDPEVNARILASLPGMYWHYPVTRAKPGATVLARHGDPRMRNQHGGHVLLATQLVGPGRTFFIGFDSTYRWRYLDEQYFDGFWARVIDRAGRSKQLGGRYPFSLTTDRATYRPGGQVTVRARFVNPDDLDPGLEALHGEVEAGDQEAQPLTLVRHPTEVGVFDATFNVTRAGPHTVRVWGTELPGDVAAAVAAAEGPTGSGASGGAGARAATLQFQVELPNVEYERPGQDRATLNLIAQASGGAVYEMADAAHLPDAFKVRQVAHVLEDRQEVWNAPVLWALILLAIFAEWVLRKRYRMV